MKSKPFLSQRDEARGCLEGLSTASFHCLLPSFQDTQQVGLKAASRSEAGTLFETGSNSVRDRAGKRQGSWMNSSGNALPSADDTPGIT